MTSITPLSAIEAPNATASPAQMLCSKARPPMRPIRNAYSAQRMAAAAVAGTNLRRG